MDITRGFSNTKHGNIEYREQGNGDQTLILLHPTPSSSAFFNELLPLLSKNRRNIAVTTMGYGQSDRPPEPYQSLEEFAQSIIWLLDELNISKASFFGAHTVGQIALSLAANWESRVDKLIVEEVFNWNNPKRKAIHEAIHKYIPEKKDGSHLIKLWNKTKNFPGLGEVPNQNHHQQLFIDQLISNSKENCESIYGDMGWEGAGPFAMCTFDTWEAVTRIAAQTLVIHGTTSELIRSQEKFINLLPNAKAITLPSQGNFIPHDAPELWVQEIENFLK
jgi:pimeloyl-ACP methyl ester carboxylesterase